MPMIHFDLDELFADLIPEEKSKKQKFTDTEHIDQFGRVSREVPQAQQPQEFATLPNNSTDSTVSTKKADTIALDNHPHGLGEKRASPLDVEKHLQLEQAPERLWGQLPVREFFSELHNHFYASSILWLEDEIEAAWKNQCPVLIKIPADCDVKPTLLEERTNQRLERYWNASPHTTALMSAELLEGSLPQLLLYRVPQDNYLLNPTETPPEPTDTLSPEDEQLIESVQHYAKYCQPGEIWEIPKDWMPDAVDLANAVDSVVRERSDEHLRVWKNNETLVCRPWGGPFLTKWKRETEQ